LAVVLAESKAMEISGHEPLPGFEPWRICPVQELRTLGKGGFGLVVGAVNRLDGRLYAIKKIRMTSHSPLSYARIMREVATLSRLQHPHVVRYFQVRVAAAPIKLLQLGAFHIFFWFGCVARE
jgi:hypothetical protein